MIEIKDELSGLVFTAKTLEDAEYMIKDRILDMSYEKFLHRAEKENRLAFYERVRSFREDIANTFEAWSRLGLFDLGSILYHKERYNFGELSYVTVKDRGSGKSYCARRVCRPSGIRLYEPSDPVRITYRGSKRNFRSQAKAAMIHRALRNAVPDSDFNWKGKRNKINFDELRIWNRHISTPSRSWKDQSKSPRQYGKHKAWCRPEKAYADLVKDGSIVSLGTKHDRRIDNAREKALSKFLMGV